MKNKILFSSCLSLLLLAGCSNDDVNDPVINSGTEIRMKSGINQVTVNSLRGAGMIENSLLTDLDVTFVRLDDNSGYPADYSNCVELSGQISSSDNVLSFSPAQYYSATDSKSKLFGWYPTSGQFTPSTGKVTFSEIDGSTDIMVTRLKEGSKSNVIPSVTFNHVLTQISVQAYASSTAVSDTWGGITSISIQNKKQACTVLLPSTNSPAEAEADISFETATGNLPLVTKNPANNNSINGKDGTSVYRQGNPLLLGTSTDMANCGYAMFAPQTYNNAGDELVLIIETEKGGTQEVKIESDLEASTSYVVTLKFGDDQISSTANISDWKTGGSLGEHEISKPDQLIQELARKSVNDFAQTYSIFHKPTDGWVGDPMPFFDNGQYHVFYLQDARDGAVTFHPWYKATTTNFASYNDYGVMLPCVADSPEKALGTGSVIEKDGMYYAFYTAHNGDSNGEGGLLFYPRERVRLATSSDLKNWTKRPEVEIKAVDGYDAGEFRDPIVFFDDIAGNYKMLISTRADYKGSWRAVIAQYSSTDLFNWTLVEPFYDDESVFMVECPDIFTQGNYQYLIYSDIDDRKVHYKYRNKGTETWTVPANSTLDGIAFYAGKTAGNGSERYLFGWCPTRIDGTDNTDYSWAGALVVHKLIQQPDGSLKVTIPTSLNNQITNQVTLKTLVEQNAVVSENTYTVNGSTEKGLVVFPRLQKVNKIEATVKPTDAKRFGFEFAAYENQEYVYDIVFDIENNELRLDSKLKQTKLNTITSTILPQAVNSEYKVTVLIENSVCVVYINDEVAFTNRIYSMAQNPWGVFAEDGEAKFDINIFK